MTSTQTPTYGRPSRRRLVSIRSSAWWITCRRKCARLLRQHLLEPCFHFGRMKTEWPGLALEGHAAVAIDYVKAVRPACISAFGGVIKTIQKGRDFEV